MIFSIGRGVSTFVWTNPIYVPMFAIFRRSTFCLSKGGGGAESAPPPLGCEMGSKDPAPLGLHSKMMITSAYLVILFLFIPRNYWHCLPSMMKYHIQHYCKCITMLNGVIIFHASYVVGMNVYNIIMNMMKTLWLDIHNCAVKIYRFNSIHGLNDMKI